jgi:hypothetical protein
VKLPCLLLSLAATLVGVGATGCAAPASPDEETGAATEALGQSINVPNPSGAYFASVTANGSGCPAGSWEAGISDDGQAFTVTFSGYEAVVEPGAAFSIKDCALAIDLKTPEGFSFSVSSFHYQGYAILDQPGMTAKQTAKYYFMGNPVPARELRSDMNGPYDSSYVFSDQIGVADLVWSPCGATRRLNAQTRLVLQNNAQKTGSGYLNTTSVDGEVKTVFRFGLAWKQCGGPPPPPPPPPCGTLSSGESLVQGEKVASCDGRNELWHQSDGHVVLYHDGRPLWWTGVLDATSEVLTMQSDGNLVQYAPGGRPLWHTSTHGHGGARVSVQDDCNVVIYDANNTALWSSNTWGCVAH